LLNPFNDIGFLEIKVVPHKIDAGIVESTEVVLAYSGDGPTKEKTLIVLPNSTEQSWKLRLTNMANRSFSYKLIHHLKDRTTREVPSVTTKATTIFVDDPFEDALDLQLIPFYDVTAIKQVFIDIEYNDPDNNYSRNERIIIKSPAQDIQSLRISILDNKKRTFRYRITTIGTNGKIHQNPFLETDDTFVPVG
jgi:hypothetical protein